jgi:hypothetical protein
MSPLPTTLVRFRGELEDAIRRDQARERVRVRRRWTVRVAIAGVAAAAIALGVLSALPGSGPSVVERAAAALNPAVNTVAHTKTVTSVMRDGALEVYRTDVWEAYAVPGGVRRVEDGSFPDGPHVIGGHVVNGRRVFHIEEAYTGFYVGSQSVYDPATKTIYFDSSRPKAHQLPAQPALPGHDSPAFCRVEGNATRKQLGRCAYPIFDPGPTPDTVRLTELTRLNDSKPYRWSVGHRVVSKKEAEELRDRLYPPFPTQEVNRSIVMGLLEGTDVKVTGDVRVGGRDALRLVGNAGRSVYLVDAETYAPIEFLQLNRSHNRSRTTRFVVFESLPLNAETRKLVSLQAQHPRARVVYDAKAFVAAENRLVPHG